MKPAPFRYRAPETVEEVVELLEEHGDEAKLLAGGQSLVPAMNFRLAQPAVLIDLNRVAGLSFLDEVAAGGSGTLAEGGGDGTAARAERDGSGANDKPQVLRIGAMTRQAILERDARVRASNPLLAAAIPYIAHRQIRNRGTVGGSIAHADPAAELPAVALASSARVKLVDSTGERWVDAADFFQGLFWTAMGPREVLTEVEVPPIPETTGWSFQEVARRHGDYALVGVAVTMTTDGDRFARVRIVLFAVGGAPVIAAAAEESLSGAPINATAISTAARVAAREDIDPLADIHASTEFRRHLAEVLVRRALHEALARATGQPSRQDNRIP